MLSFRERIKRYAPSSIRGAVNDFRRTFEPPPFEETALHGYAVHRAPEEAMRLSFVLPVLARKNLYGGVTTGLDIFLAIGRRVGADLRILLDDFDRSVDRDFIAKAARKVDVDPARIEINFRTASIEPVDVRRDEFFLAFNWWTALNLLPVLGCQHELFGGKRRPLLYLVQEYDPQFYPFSSTHLLARASYETKERVWGLFNSSQLHNYFRAQGHKFEREHVFEPRLSDALRPFLETGPVPKEKRILVYGRPSIPRNCFPAVVSGLREWTKRHPQYADWVVTSAGLKHKPVPIGGGRAMNSLGMLSLEDYANLLRRAAIGVSLQASPHPSYPPLEMAHFGVSTLTNRYLCKDLSSAHDNIMSLSDIAPQTIADALAEACLRFETSPDAGWRGKSHMPDYLAEGPYPFLDLLAADIAAEASAKRLVETGTG